MTTATTHEAGPGRETGGSSQPGPRADLPHALITGASQGLGRAFAEECARYGKNLILVSLADTGLKEAGGRIALHYDVRVYCREMDLTAAGAPEELYKWIREQGLAVDLLINNAGIGSSGPFESSALERNETIINLNILALVRLTHLFLPELKRRPRSHILNVASLAAFYPMPYKSVYAPSKSFVLNFSLALRSELAHSPVRISALCPGGIMTNEECRKLIAAQGFFGRISCHYPEEVARTALRELFRDRAVIVPGLVNKLVRALGALAPPGLVQLIIRRRFGCSLTARRPRYLYSLPLSGHRR